jgi:hypothetical protein
LSHEVVSLLSASIRNLVFLALLGFMVMILAFMVVSRRSLIEVLKQAIMGRGRSSRRESILLRALLSSVSLLIPFLVFYFFSRSSASPESGEANPLLPPSGAPVADGNLTSISWPFRPEPSAFVSIGVRYAGVIVAFGIAVVLAFIMFQAVRETTSEYEEMIQDSPEEEVRVSALTAVQEAIRRIEAEEDFRMAVITCYRRLCEILEEHGFPIGEYQTAREYESTVSGVLDVPTESLSTLTGLFEEARYSSHEIGKEERNCALNSLSEIRNCLSGVSADG